MNIETFVATARRVVQTSYLPMAGALVLASVYATPRIAEAYPVKPPWRADSLPADNFMITKGHGGYNCPGNCGIDLKVWRLDPTSSAWTFLKPGSTATPTPHEDHLAWGMPLFSPVDGEVVACWWNMEEDLPGGSVGPTNGEPLSCFSTPDGGCVVSGNHLMIRTFDGHVVYLAHLQRGSIPAGLCPIPGTATTNLTLTASSGEVCNKSGWGGMWNGARLDLQPGFTAYPQVKKGDFVARIGSSGGSDAPHLHMSVYEYSEDSIVTKNPCIRGEPWEFSEAFSQEVVSGVEPDVNDWDRLEGEELPFDGVTGFHLWGDPLGPRNDHVFVENGTMPAVAATASGGLIAYKNSSNILEAAGFTIDLAGQIDLGPEDVRSGAVDFDVARINQVDPHAVVAYIDGTTTRLSLLPYFVESDADIIAGGLHSELSSGAQLVRATASPNDNGIVVAIKNSLDGVSVVNYETTRVGTHITVSREASDLTSPEIIDLDVATIVAGRARSETTGAFKGVVTAERRDDNTLWLQSWKLDSTGSNLDQIDAKQVTTLVGNVGFGVSEVDVTVTGSFGREYILVSSALDTGSSSLRLQTWEVSSLGILGKVDQFDGGGPISHLSSTRSGLQDALVGMRLGTSSHTLLSFHVTSDGLIRRVGTWDGENIQALALAGRSSQEDAIALFRTASGMLDLARYVTNYMWSL